ncbi:hypothetical protein BV898_15752 [Hypsibius exemplaris]|uniref:Uncharacterized protein n=1 Tax=Hypsibius exemplaris TaxID=2072580 RepID=A0A9X6RKR4_HYPEX|nr:hypothetical protein BV898_15752 [Hypsibius exemplaris]
MVRTRRNRTLQYHARIGRMDWAKAVPVGEAPADLIPHGYGPLGHATRDGPHRNRWRCPSYSSNRRYPQEERCNFRWCSNRVSNWLQRNGLLKSKWTREYWTRRYKRASDRQREGMNGWWEFAQKKRVERRVHNSDPVDMTNQLNCRPGSSSRKRVGPNKTSKSEILEVTDLESEKSGVAVGAGSVCTRSGRWSVPEQFRPHGTECGTDRTEHDRVTSETIPTKPEAVLGVTGANPTEPGFERKCALRSPEGSQPRAVGVKTKHQRVRGEPTGITPTEPGYDRKKVSRSPGPDVPAGKLHSFSRQSGTSQCQGCMAPKWKWSIRWIASNKNGTDPAPPERIRLAAGSYDNN